MRMTMIFAKMKWSNYGYDCTDEIKEHIALVRKWMDDFCYILRSRASMRPETNENV